MKKRTKIISGLLAVAVVGGAIWYANRSDPEAGITTDSVRRGDVAQTVSVTGKIVPALYADLSFLRTGRIANVSVSEGDRVAADQEIASLDDESLRSEWKAALIALSIAEENEKLARRDWDGLKLEERAAKKLATEQARESVRSIGISMKNLSLVTPIAGTVSSLDIRSGETATVGVVVARISGDGESIIESQVPESDVVEIVIGMKAKITFDSLSQDDVFEAEVTDIDKAATVSQGVVSYMTRFRLSSVDDRLREGMTANIDIETARAGNVPMVPSRAISREGARSFVEVKRGKGIFEKVEIMTGIEGDDGLVEAKSGLREGDEVVVSRKK
ncbi:MAG: efflux RND transporter periplasmic adaptor subunit [Candidatus Moranbacteria bacterium]|nr:efflux RND transporter periplasmic adaptor subunit [Candidatus Moranbacteria bacterium]